MIEGNNGNVNLKRWRLSDYCGLAHLCSLRPSLDCPRHELYTPHTERALGYSGTQSVLIDEKCAIGTSFSA